MATSFSICKLVSYTQQLESVPGDVEVQNTTGTQCIYLLTDTRNQVQKDFSACTKLTAVQVCLKLFKTSWQSGPQSHMQRHTAKATLFCTHRAMN